MAESALLEVTGLVKRYGALAATDGANLRVAAGEIHALIGPNGAGKTSLLAQIAGTLLPDAGSIRFQGQEIARLPAHRRVRLGLARSFQITRLFRGLSALRNVALAVQAAQGSSLSFWRPVARESALFEQARAVLASVGLEAREATLSEDLSHGEQRALEVALALATGPRLLLLDEPLAGMGAQESAAMVSLIERLRGRATVLLVEHDMQAVFQLADRVSVLVSGRVIACGTPDEIRANPTVISAYLGDEALS